MNAIIVPPPSSLVEPPKSELGINAIEQKLGLLPTCPINNSPAVIERDVRIVGTAQRQGIDLEFAGYQKKLPGLTMVYDTQKKVNWALMPLEEDRSGERGMPVPSRVVKNIEKAHAARLFNKYYIAHAWKSPRGDVSSSAIIPWEELKSPANRRMRQILQESTRIDQAFWNILVKSLHKMGAASIYFILLIISLIVAIAVGLLVVITAKFIIQLVITIVISIGALAVTIGGSIVFFSTADPILYGVAIEHDAQGEEVAMFYKIGQWNI